MFSTKKRSIAIALSTLPFMAFSQLTISGKVKNKMSQETIAGSTISIDDTFISTQSKSDGSYEIKNLKAGVYVIHASFIGFQKYTDTVHLT